MDDSNYGSYDSCNTCPTGGCGSDGLFGGLGDRNMQLVFGAEYIYAQATFSEALAYVEQNAIEGGETWHQIDFDYNSSYSFYGGVYLCDCGGSVLFDYTRMTSDGDYAASESTGIDIFGPFEIDGNIEGHADVDLKSYDLSLREDDPARLPPRRRRLRRLLRRHVLRRRIVRHWLRRRLVPRVGHHLVGRHSLRQRRLGQPDHGV